MAKGKKERNKGDDAVLEMTPMIDVVFQLLIFFIVTLKQNDILSALDALRPAPDPNAKGDSINEPITVLVGRQGFVFNGRPKSESQLARDFQQLARIDKNAMVMVKCTGDSPHGYLVRVLDELAAAGLYKVSVFSM